MPVIRAALPFEPDWPVCHEVVAGRNPELSDSLLPWQFAPAGFLSPALDGRFVGGAAEGLVAVDTMLHFYARGEFQAETRKRRFCSDPTPAARPAVQILPPLPADHCRLPQEEISVLRFADTDRQCFPVERTTFVNNWITPAECVVLAGMRDAGSFRRCANSPGRIPQVHSERIPGITTQEIESCDWD
jgi:hypothetical protein